MRLSVLTPLLHRIHGATFAAIDAETYPNRGVRCVMKGERVIIFRTNGMSGYEGIVKRRLMEAGKDPESFQVGPLPWGERVDNLPLIRHNHKYYLQVVRLADGQRSYFIGNTDVMIDPKDLDIYGIHPRFMAGQGLPSDSQVCVSTYNIENIKRIVIMGNEVFDTAVIGTNAVLKLSPLE